MTEVAVTSLDESKLHKRVGEEVAQSLHGMLSVPSSPCRENPFAELFPGQKAVGLSSSHQQPQDQGLCSTGLPRINQRNLFLEGFQDCATEVLRFLRDVENVEDNNPLVLGLQSHLQVVSNAICHENIVDLDNTSEHSEDGNTECWSCSDRLPPTVLTKSSSSSSAMDALLVESGISTSSYLNNCSNMDPAHIEQHSFVSRDNANVIYCHELEGTAVHKKSCICSGLCECSDTKSRVIPSLSQIASLSLTSQNDISVELDSSSRTILRDRSLSPVVQYIHPQECSSLRVPQNVHCEDNLLSHDSLPNTSSPVRTTPAVLSDISLLNDNISSSLLSPSVSSSTVHPSLHPPQLSSTAVHPSSDLPQTRNSPGSILELKANFLPGIESSIASGNFADILLAVESCRFHQDPQVKALAQELMDLIHGGDDFDDDDDNYDINDSVLEGGDGAEHHSSIISDRDNESGIEMMDQSMEWGNPDEMIEQ